MRSYLQLTRAHTTPLEAVPALIGALLATGGKLTPLVVVSGVFGVLYHLVGYGMNSYVDWQKGYDRDDEHKQHHPLNAGTMTSKQAKYSLLGLGFMAVLVGLYLSLQNPLSLIILIAMVLSGSAYNLYGKTTHLKFAPISLAHALVFVFPYYALGGDLLWLPFILISIYVFLWVMFQISVSGEIKDLMQDEENLLIGMGTLVDKDNDRVYISPEAVMYSMGIKLLSFAFIMFAVYRLSGYMVLDATVIILSVIGIVVSSILISKQIGVYNRKESITIMSIVELIMLATFIIATAPVIGYPLAVAILFVSVGWVTTFNMVQWQTIIAPEV